MTKRVLFALAWAGVTIAAVWVCFGAGNFTHGGSERLRKQVPAWFSIQSYNDAVRLIHERTGLAVSCPGDLEALLKAAPVGGGLRGEPPDKEEPTREFLNHVVRCMLGLNWKFDAGKGQIELGLSWRKSDPRSPAELLQCLWKGPQAKGPDWQQTLDALLSKPANFDKAWRVRQFSRYQSVFHGVNGERFLVKRVVSETLDPYVLVMIRHRIQTFPGRGAVSYYWFKEDGTLQGADLIDSGWRCDLTDGEVTPDLEQNALTASGPSEIRWMVTANLSSTYTVRFRFTNQGLQWIESTNSKGEEANLPLGDSLMPRLAEF